jgi:OTU domain-containing protein 6
MDEILARHRKEKKDLQGKIQQLKKNSGKKKKEVTEEINQLEADLLKRHTEELANLDLNKDSEEVPVEEKPPVEDSVEKPGAQRLSKAQKRREKKAEKDKEREELIKVGEEENKTGPRLMELKAINKILKDRGLVLHAIPSDGDCLYNAVAHQLMEHGLGFHDIPKLRNLTADYIERNKDSLIFYMMNPETDEILNDQEFENYCELIKTTKAWGGQVEIQALSNSLKVPIEVLQATGPPTIQGSEFGKTNLVLTYHRHLYNLGEHYNSTKLKGQDQDEEEEQ